MRGTGKLSSTNYESSSTESGEGHDYDQNSCDTCEICVV